MAPWRNYKWFRMAETEEKMEREAKGEDEEKMEPE